MKTENKKPIKKYIGSFLTTIVKHLPSIILALIIVIAAIFVINYKPVAEEKELVQPYTFEGNDTPVVVDNGELKLTMDPLTTAFELEVKDSGKVWRSNPADVLEDTAALDDQKTFLQSPLVMSYSITQGLETTYSTFGYSTNNGIYEIVPGDNEIRVNYSLGNVEKEYVVPPVITETEMNDWLSKMDKKEADLVKQYYKKYDINKLTAKDNKDELLANYPSMENEVIYVLRSGTKENVKKTIEEKFASVGYTYENILADKELDLSVKT